MNALSRLGAASAVAVALLGASVVSSSAVTITSGGAAPGTSIGLGTNTLQTIVLNSTAQVETDFFFTPLINGTFSANSVETTSAGQNALNPFSIQLVNLTTSTILGTNASPVGQFGSETVGLSGLAVIFGNNYELKVIAAATGDVTFPVNIDGNVTLNATPLPGALPLMAGGLGMIGLFVRRKKRNSVAA